MVSIQAIRIYVTTIHLRIDCIICAVYHIRVRLSQAMAQVKLTVLPPLCPTVVQTNDVVPIRCRYVAVRSYIYWLLCPIDHSAAVYAVSHSMCYPAPTFTLHGIHTPDSHFCPLCVVRAQLFDMAEIRFIYSASHIFTGKNGTIKCLDARIELSDGGDEVRERLEDDQVCANGFCDRICIALECDKLVTGRHVNPVHV